MEYNAFAIVAVLVLIVGAFFLGKVIAENKALCYEVEHKERISDAQIIAYREGFSAAQAIYHDEPIEREKRDYNLLEKELAKENSFIGVPDDIMIAYGVQNVSQLPKAVREQFNIQD